MKQIKSVYILESRFIVRVSKFLAKSQKATIDNRILKIAKKFTIFNVSMSDELEMEIVGSNFLTAPAFRSSGRLTTAHHLENAL